MKSLFNTLSLLQAYEQAIDESIICSITDTTGVIKHVNKKFCEISKYSANELIGQNHRIINSGFHSKEFFKTMWQTIGIGDVYHNEIKNKAKDQTYYWVDTVIVPIKAEKGKVTLYLSLRTLITERKQLQKEKERYVSSLETLLVMTSNNMKKPLSNCLKQMNIFNAEKLSSKSELKPIVDNLKLSTSELTDFMRELEVFIRDMKSKTEYNNELTVSPTNSFEEK